MRQVSTILTCLTSSPGPDLTNPNREPLVEDDEVREFQQDEDPVGRVRALIVVTHPEAEHHVAGLVGGWYDSALTARGEEQARRIATYLRARIPEAAPVEIHSSDLRRCVQTATQIAGRVQASILLSPDLREISYGEAEGKPRAWLEARFRFPPPENNPARLDHEYGLAGAETRRNAATPFYRAMEKILASPVDHQIIVTHGFVLTFIVASWIGMPVEAVGLIGIPVHSGSITVLRQEAPFYNRSVVTLNNTSHLAQTR